MKKGRLPVPLCIFGDLKTEINLAEDRFSQKYLSAVWPQVENATAI